MNLGRNIVFYVSGHGYGHATRVAEIVRVISSMDARGKYYIRTRAPANFFQGHGGGLISSIDRVTIDSGVFERDALHVNSVLTLAKVAEILAKKNEIIESELKYLQKHNISLVVADIPYLAGDIANIAGVPCIAISNFTWDWIYEPLVGDLPDFKEEYLQEIRSSYKKIPTLLELPFGDHNALGRLFKSIIKVPLVARRSIRDPVDIIKELGLDQRNKRPLVLFGMRGGIQSNILKKAASMAKDFIFITTNYTSKDIVDNIINIPSSRVSFIDLLRVCAVVISKLGYSIVAECIANKVVGLLCPPRVGFREDEVMRADAPRYLRTREISIEEYNQGIWEEHIKALMSMNGPLNSISTQGAEECALHLKSSL